MPIFEAVPVDAWIDPRAVTVSTILRHVRRGRVSDVQLLGDGAPEATGLADTSPRGKVTPETYLGFERLGANGGEPVVENEAHAYTFPPGLLDNELAFGGIWTVEDERAVAGLSAGILLQYRARDVFLVLTGRGAVEVLVDGRRERTVRVRGDRLYMLVDREKTGDHRLELRFTPGVAAYAFTFG